MLAHNDATAMIAVKDLGRARKFYENVLGLTPSAPQSSEVQVYQTGNSKIAVYVSQYAGTNRATAVTWEVGDVEAVVRDLKERGVGFEHYDMPQTRRVGDVHMSGPIRNAWFKDPDGNILSLINRMDVSQDRQSDVASDAASNR
jgi:catechol 2,3-dioxygenase-like lactoylglutathione lyase family enzyme